MAYVLKAHTSVASPDSNAVTTSGIDTTGADLIVVGVGWFASGAGGTVNSDSKGNTPYTNLTKQQTGSSLDNAQIYYFQAPVVGTGHTFTNGANGVAPAIAPVSFSGSTASPFDVQNGTTVDGVTSIQPGSITPGFDNELIISVISIDGTFTSLAIGSGFTLLEQQNASANNEGLGFAYLIQGAKAAVNPTWSWTTTRNAAVVIASFKAATVATMPGMPWQFQGGIGALIAQ